MNAIQQLRDWEVAELRKMWGPGFVFWPAPNRNAAETMRQLSDAMRQMPYCTCHTGRCKLHKRYGS